MLRYDSVASVFNFKFYFDPKNQEHAELFAVSHFHEAILEHNNETLVTGFMLSSKFNYKPTKELTQIGGYSKSGVLEDSNIPPNLYPLQVDGLTLAQIANKLCAPFGFKVVVDSSVSDKMNKKIKTTTFESTETIKEVLTKLCVQRKIIMTHNEFGDLVFTKVKTDKQPLITFTKGVPGTEMELMFDGQKLHSDITVMRESSTDGGNAGEYTISNPFVPVAYTYRPKTVTQSSGDETTVKEYAEQILANEIKSAIVLTIKTDRWEIDGKIIKPNNIINVFAPELFIYKETQWFIEEITFEGNESRTVATLKCVLPCCYDGTKPKNVFIDPHENFPRFEYEKNNTGVTTFR